MPEEKRVSKWDKGPEGSQIALPTATDGQLPTNEKPVRVSRFDQGPAANSKGDKCSSKWDKRPNENSVLEVAANVKTEDSNCNGDTARSGMQAAAEAAARVNAMLMAKGVLKPAQPLIVNDSMLRAKPAAGGAVSSEVDINDLTIICRNALTRGATQEEVSRLSGASVSTRGRYMSKDERQSNPVDGEKPLHLFVQGSTQDSVNKAVAKIQEIITSHERQKGGRQSVGALSNIRPNLGISTAPQPLMSLNPNPTGLAYVQEKLFIGLEHAPPNFEVKNRVQGVNGSYLTHIQNETGAKVILRGKGSGFIEPTSGREAFEPMYIYIQHPTTIGLQAAKLLASNLIETVRQEFSQFQQSLAAMPPTVSPGTASLLAGLHQQQQVPGFVNPYTSPYGCASYNMSSIPAQTQPGLMSSGLPVLPSNQVAPPGNVGTNYWPLTCQSQHSISSGLESGVHSVAPELIAESSSSNVTSSSYSCATNVGSLNSFSQPATLGSSLLPPVIPSPSFLPPPSYFPNQHPSIMPPFQTSPMLPPTLPPPVFSAIPGVVPSLVPPSVPCVTSGSMMPNSRLPTPVLSVSAASTSSTSTRRRFKEEKEDEKLPDHLLGYQHGPLHLKSTLVGASDGNVNKQSAPSEDASLASRSKASNKSSRYSPTRSLSDDDEDINEKTLMPPPLAVPVVVPVSHVSVSAFTTSSRLPTDTFAAPLAPIRPRPDKDKKPIKITRDEPEKKKFKGALISVAMSYTSDDDDDDDDDLADTETN